VLKVLADNAKKAWTWDEVEPAKERPKPKPRKTKQRRQKPKRRPGQAKTPPGYVNPWLMSDKLPKSHMPPIYGEEIPEGYFDKDQPYMKDMWMDDSKLGPLGTGWET